MGNASKANSELFGKGVPPAQAGPVFEELKRRLNAAVDAYENPHEPEYLVTGSKGSSVRRIRRKEDGTWEPVTSLAVPGRGAEERGALDATVGEQPSGDKEGEAET